MNRAAFAAHSTGMDTNADRTVCTEDGCAASVPNHRWGHTLAEGWFFSRREKTAHCPEHLPDWVEAWRARKAAARD